MHFHLATALLFAATAHASLNHLASRQDSDSHSDGDGGSDSPSPTMSAGTLDCLSAIGGLTSDAPTPPPDIMAQISAYAMTATTPIDARCGWVTGLPASVVPEYMTYQSSIASWFSAHSDEVSSVLKTDCAVETDAAMSLGPCTVTPAAAAGAGVTTGSSSETSAAVTTTMSGSQSGMTTTSQTGTASGTAAPASTTQSKNAAPLPTAVFGAAAAAAALLAGVIAL